jgi:hypothetical protein
MPSRVGALRLRNLAFFLVFASLSLLLAHLARVWLATVKPGPDYFSVFLRDVFDPRVYAVREGATRNIVYVPAAIAILISLFIIQRIILDGHDFVIIWTNKWFLSLTVISLALGGIFALVAQAENWYWDPVRNAPGQVDIITHFLAGRMIAMFLANFSWMDMFALRGQRGRALETAFVWLITLIIAVNFEIEENLHPEIYWNDYWNSLQDVFMGWLGAVEATAEYNAVVPFAMPFGVLRVLRRKGGG